MNKINISIDDVSPHPKSSINILNKCYKLIEIFHDIKITLFVPIAYWRTLGETSTNKPLFISNYPEFCNTLKNLNDKNFELGYHGYYHGIPKKTNNDEFKTLTQEEAEKKINFMEQELKKAGLYEKFKKIFRPPAWRMSPGAIKAFKNKDFKLCLSQNPSPITNEKFYNTNIKNVNYANIFPPFIPLKEMSEMNIVYHACEWDKNYLSEEKTDNLIKFLKNIKNKEFCFM